MYLYSVAAVCRQLFLIFSSFLTAECFDCYISGHPPSIKIGLKSTKQSRFNFFMVTHFSFDLFLNKFVYGEQNLFFSRLPSER